MGLFSREKDPKEQVREWGSKLRKEGHALDRQIMQIKRTEQQTLAEMKREGKKGNIAACKIMGKSVLEARNAVTRIYTAKANLNSVDVQLKQQLATIRVTGALQSSTEVMQAMGKLVSVGEISATMRELSKEMMKTGLISEMTEEVLEDAMGDVDEEEVDQQVENILYEVTKGALGVAPNAPEKQPAASKPTAVEQVESEEEDEEMIKRLDALKA